MAINSATKKVEAASATQPQEAKGKSTPAPAQRSKKVTPLAGHEQRAATLRLYIKDKDLLKEAKMAALEDDTSLSQLWEEWAMEWLKNR